MWPGDEPLAERRRVGETLERGIQVAVVAQIEQTDAFRADARPCQVKRWCRYFCYSIRRRYCH